MENDSEQPTLSPSTKYSDELSIVFGNISGLNAKKRSKLRTLTKHDHLICLNETNLSQNDSILLTDSGLGNTAVIKALDNISFNRGKRTVPTRNGQASRKHHGYGTAIISKLPDHTVLKPCEYEEELVSAFLNLNGLNGLIVTGYRSPSSKHKPDIDTFYDRLASIIDNQKSSDNLDFIIFVGDDNASASSSCHYSRYAATLMENVARRFQMIDLIPGLATRNNKQPDSCFGYFDPERIELRASVMTELGSDHRMIQIKARKSEIVPVIPKFKKMTHRVQIVTNEVVDERMREVCDKWTSIAEDTVDETILNKATNTLIEAIKVALNSSFKRKIRKVYAKARSDDDETDLSILRLRAMISKYAHQIQKKNGDNILAREKLLKCSYELKELVRKAAIAQFNEDMRKQEKAEELNDTSFWKLTGSLLNKFAYPTAINREPNDEELLAKLDKIDLTFTNNDPNFDQDLLSYKNITPEAIYQLSENTDDLAELIKGTSKLSNHIKRSSKPIGSAFSVLTKIMNKTRTFPTCCNVSNCRFIGLGSKERAIFSLNPVPKIVETIAKASFDKLKTEDGTHQMAYTKNRGCTSCNALTLQFVEMCNEPSLHSQQDLEKAFNKAAREIILREMQRKYGAGDFIASWFKNRVYTFRTSFGELTRGLGHNTGVPAGTLIGVECFMAFIATCTSLTGKNKDLLWAALYADDTSPLVQASKILQFQEALDWAMNWAEKNGCRFHLFSDKAPTFLAYLKKGQLFPTSFHNLKLGPATLKRTDEARILGLIRKVRPSDADPNQSYGKMIDHFGYECAWDEIKLKQIAYRLQLIKYDVVPEFMKKLVASYFCGVVRFSSSILWLRSSLAHRKRVRYYYCMALSAAVGLTTAESLNLACCKHMSVDENNSGYLKLLQETGLPSIEEMACRDAVSVVKQAHLLYPDWFNIGTKRQQQSDKNSGKFPDVKGIKAEVKNTLMDSLVSLKHKYTTVFQPKKSILTQQKLKIRENYKVKIEDLVEKKQFKKLQEILVKRKTELAEIDTPCLVRYFRAKESCKTKSATDFSHLLRTFTLSSRYEFDCLDTASRINNFKTPIPSVITDVPSQLNRRTTPARTRQRPAKRARILCRVSTWNGNQIKCRFCSEQLPISRQQQSRSKFDSHLVHHCLGIPNSVPLPTNRKPRPKDLMARLAAIGAVPDPGGDV